MEELLVKYEKKLSLLEDGLGESIRLDLENETDHYSAQITIVSEVIADLQETISQKSEKKVGLNA